MIYEHHLQDSIYQIQDSIDMIPWFELHTIPIGPISIQTWGTLVATGLLTAFWAAARRAKKLGQVAPKHVWDFATWAFLFAFVCARIFHVLFYDPAWYMSHPWDAINPALPGYSMVGGLLGGVLAGLIYVRWHKLNMWDMSDLAGYATPLGIGIGRIGCFLIHDHPGTPTNFFLGVQYPDGGRHDHGLYLSLIGWLMFVAFWSLGRKPRRDGFFAGWFLVLDGAMRFYLDFYRAVDVKYGGLTPTQWLLMLSVLLGAVILNKARLPSWALRKISTK